VLSENRLEVPAEFGHRSDTRTDILVEEIRNIKKELAESERRNEKLEGELKSNNKRRN
jgi:predicted RNase H-like nuclease (RuvC/YqgF family)